MKLKEWRSMRHWNAALGLRLDRFNVESLDNLTAAIATDERFRGIEGCAKIWSNGKCRTIFSPDLVREMVEAIKSTDRLDSFLCACDGVRFIDTPTDSSGYSYFQDEDEALDRLKLTQEQREYAERVYQSLAYGFGYERFYLKDLSSYADPGLMRTVGQIARKRYPMEKSTVDRAHRSRQGGEERESSARR